MRRSLMRLCGLKGYNVSKKGFCLEVNGGSENTGVLFVGQLKRAFVRVIWVKGCQS